MKNILNKIGLTTLKSQAETVNYLLDIEKRLDSENKEKDETIHELKLNYNKLFNWDLFVPELSFKEYQILVGKEKLPLGKEWSELHNEYYDKYCRSQYQAFILRSLSLEPYMLTAFILKFSHVNWQKIADIMKESNWCWSSKDRTPTIDELKDCVITLIPLNSYNSVGNSISSGGFEVSLYYNENKEPICNITFDGQTYYK